MDGATIQMDSQEQEIALVGPNYLKSKYKKANKNAHKYLQVDNFVLRCLVKKIKNSYKNNN